MELDPPSHSVSVIIPAYNTGSFIRATVDSALNQTLSPLEVIVVDDGSTDGTSEELAAIRDPRLHVIRRENGGLCVARNTGAEVAAGEYLAFLDADDMWRPAKLQRVVDTFRANPQVDLVFDASLWIDEAGRDMGRAVRRWNGPLSLRQMLLEFVITNGSSFVVRRSAYVQTGGFDSAHVGFDDQGFCFLVGRQRPGNLFGLPEALTLYRRRSGQISGNWRHGIHFWTNAMNLYRQHEPELVAEVEKRSRARSLRGWAAIAHESGDSADGARLLRQAFQLAPLDLMRDSRTWFTIAAVLSGVLLPGGVGRRLEQVGRRLRTQGRSA